MKVHKIFIVDDEVLISNALKVVIGTQADMEVVGVAHNGSDALHQLKHIHPDLVIMDVRMPTMDGIECTQKIKEHYPEILILIHTTFNEESYIIDGLASGANGYLLKGLDFAQLLNTIRSTLIGQYILPAEVAAKLSTYLMNNKNSSKDLHALPSFITDSYTLTAREQEILLLLGNRLSIREISDHMHISEGTAKNYLTVVYEKLNVSNRYEAITLLRK